MISKSSEQHSKRAADAVNPQRVAHLTSRLVQCETANPPGDERSIVPVLVKELKALGCEVEVFSVDERRPSVLARFPGAPTGAPVLAVNGHIDVVPVVPARWADDPFGGVIRDGRVVGRGACDMKGGIAAAIEALHALRDTGTAPSCRIELHLVADEETGSRWGTIALASSGKIDADACIVPEPNNLTIGVAERGTLMASITVHGRGAHGSDPTVGHSAVADAARVATALHLRDFGEAEHPYLGRPTCNVGTIDGGSAPNIVADVCTLTIDRRTLPAGTLNEVLDEIHSVVSALEPKIDFEIELMAFVPASEIAPSHPFVGAVRAAALRHLDTAPITGSLLGSDARILRNDLGIPTVVFGPGSPALAHTSEEFVEIVDLAAAARVFADVFTSYGQN